MKLLDPPPSHETARCSTLEAAEPALGVRRFFYFGTFFSSQCRSPGALFFLFIFLARAAALECYKLPCLAEPRALNPRLSNTHWTESLDHCQ